MKSSYEMPQNMTSTKSEYAHPELLCEPIG